MQFFSHGNAVIPVVLLLFLNHPCYLRQTASFTVAPASCTRPRRQPPAAILKPGPTALVRRQFPFGFAGSSCDHWPRSKSVSLFSLTEDYSRSVPANATKNVATRTSTPATTTSRRVVRRVERNTRYPVWPAWNGVLIWLVGKVLGDETASKLEHTVTGRVCPNFFRYEETSPFIMLVHHCHSFAAWDPLRWFQSTFFPEGFPAHPHRGFVTVTYFRAGGFTHRDSLGCKQVYGASTAASRQKYEHSTQWLNTGAGILHEEMFDNSASNWLWPPVRQELYQLWLNLPRSHKMGTPSSMLVGGCENGESTTPVVRQSGSETTVVAGSYRGVQAAAPIQTDLALLHVRLSSKDSRWTYHVPSNYETLLVYVRRGSLVAGGAEDESVSYLPVHHMIYFSSSGDELELRAAGPDGADFFVMAGQPIREPCAASGSMVMNSAEEINRAYADYQVGLFGKPWDHKLTDGEWRDHVEQNPSIYKY